MGTKYAHLLMTYIHNPSQIATKINSLKTTTHFAGARPWYTCTYWSGNKGARHLVILIRTTKPQRLNKERCLMQQLSLLFGVVLALC